MFKIGKQVIKQLLFHLVQLRARNVRIHNIEPSRIRITADGRNLVFTDLKNIFDAKAEGPPHHQTEAPYKADYHTNKEREEYQRHAREYYATGMILLEIILETPLVLPLANE